VGRREGFTTVLPEERQTVDDGSMVCRFFCAKGGAMKNNRPLVYEAFIGCKVRPAERQALEALAQRSQRSMSEEIRALIIREAQRDLRHAEDFGGDAA
jgi:hypothetical protein